MDSLYIDKMFKEVDENIVLDDEQKEVVLDDVIPVCINSGELLTGVTMEYLEELGLLKMDFLALRNLTIIQNVLELIEKEYEKLDIEEQHKLIEHKTVKNVDILLFI